MKLITVGRSIENSFQLEDKSVSRKHAKLIFKESGEIELVDLNSSYGTFLVTGGVSKKVTQCLVEPSQSILFGESGPHLVHDIVNSLEEVTRIAPRSQNTNANAQTDPGIATSNRKKRCFHCSGVMLFEWSLCPSCGGKN